MNTKQKELFNKICEIHDDLYELKIEYKELSPGKTIIRSWRDRDHNLKSENEGDKRKT